MGRGSLPSEAESEAPDSHVIISALSIVSASAARRGARAAHTAPMRVMRRHDYHSHTGWLPVSTRNKTRRGVARDA